LSCSIGSQITNKDLENISNIEKLEKLDISETNITDCGLQYIYGLKLICQNCMKISDFGVENLIEFSSKLELLDVRKCKLNEVYIRMIATAAYSNRSNNIH
jgi:hypothetical protein